MGQLLSLIRGIGSVEPYQGTSARALAVISMLIAIVAAFMAHSLSSRRFCGLDKARQVRRDHHEWFLHWWRHLFDALHRLGRLQPTPPQRGVVLPTMLMAILITVISGLVGRRARLLDRSPSRAVPRRAQDRTEAPPFAGARGRGRLRSPGGDLRQRHGLRRALPEIINDILERDLPAAIDSRKALTGDVHVPA